MRLQTSFVSRFAHSVRLSTIALASVISCSSFYATASDEVNVYSARKEALIKPALDRFSNDTGITVNLITGSADALLRRLQVEGDASPADLFVTVDAGRLFRAKDAGVLQPIKDAELESAIPANLRDSDDYWFGLSQRARVIFYNPKKVEATELSTYEDLADPKWKGRICTRSSTNIYNQSLVASMIDADGKEATLEWIKGFIGNLARPPFGGDTDLLKAVAAGVCDITLANTYYFGRLGQSSNPKDNAVYDALALFWPNQQADQRGAHVNVSGAGVTASASNIDNAIKLIRYLTNHESQVWYADVNNEYPVVEGVLPPKSLQPFGEFKADKLSLSVLGDNNRLAVELMDEAGWK
ncbi:extracellular solute-binding protein [Marinomonas mediterranea]|jgi:ABC-type Fe3+ transport system, periplasmic component|uniref:Extracellular solute-binding protein family 1 n=1 Tax=Marinomonas mediterranea (strain ATCC 700492 / JCM 21426 / NBRC 103028 / MMB-1) TaxID=717774 RepID=F2K1Z1_MARM1|nr:Fe(3+) ABC transporter substrate-binding protein [Marinomonas mediterranea]ADZ89985.1 extracellular solute-binding protein family 1 [Marinomonas mediterranea MMB-1]WCN12147.1 extracellular solute-binding protein [Marinomonas mediterranea]WCN16194.1 extracellular solute-binding protein [Marinomonas mediterranea MMB-1]